MPWRSWRGIENTRHDSPVHATKSAYRSSYQRDRRSSERVTRKTEVILRSHQFRTVSDCLCQTACDVLLLNRSEGNRRRVRAFFISPPVRMKYSLPIRSGDDSCTGSPRATNRLL